MKKAYRFGIAADFLLCGLLVLLWGGLLFFRLLKVSKGMVVYPGDLRFIGLSVGVLLVITLLAGLFLYRKAASGLSRGMWYKELVDSIPMPVIVTDKEARWREVNPEARRLLNLQEDCALEEQCSRHLIGPQGEVLEKTWFHKGAQFRITGSHLHCGDKDEGYLLLLHDLSGAHGYGEGVQWIEEVNRLLERLTSATDHFHDYTGTFARYTVRQADIIAELSEVITGIATGAIDRPEELNKKMHTVKTDMHRYVQNSQAHLEEMIRTVEELNTVRDSLGGILQDFDNAS